MTLRQLIESLQEQAASYDLDTEVAGEYEINGVTVEAIHGFPRLLVTFL